MSLLPQPGERSPHGRIYNEVGGEDIFMAEPVFDCPQCGSRCHAEFVDNGFGPFAVQAGPYCCPACGWTETRCA